MAVGVVSSSRLNEFEHFLKPAAERFGVADLLGENELLWAVFDEGQPIAAATTRLTVDDVAEVVLVGGEGHRLWIGELDRMIGEVALASGAKCIRAFGRRGWAKVLRDWNVIGERDGLVAYERWLHGQE